MTEPRRSELDLSDPSFVADPYPTFTAENESGPVAWHEATQTWLVFGHAAGSQALRDRRLGRIWSDKQPADVFEPFNLLHRNQMMENEPPNHSRLRRQVSTAFARGHVERMRPRVRALGQQLLDRVEGGSFDALADFAEPLPVLVICELLGAPSEHFALLRGWSQAIVRMYEPSVSGDVQVQALAASRDFADYMRQLIAGRRTDLGSDLLSDLLRAQGGEDGLSDDEVLASAILLLNAGHEASVNVFGNGLVALLRAPEQWRRFVRGEVNAATVVEELLRYDSALQLFERTATSDARVGDVTVRRGEKVAVLLGAANRDPAVFEQADQLDVGRHPNPHLAFGAGVHFCLGAPLARVELAESLRLLSSAYPDLTLACDPVRRPTFVLRGYHDVPVRSARRKG
ncbi:MAG: cytochrome P450 [Actinomycetota bacterium]|nr:cytochrome P450 [Actinomycetota bacterium]